MKRIAWRHFLFSLVFVLIAGPMPLTASAEIESVAEAINKAGRQRMLTQRIVRAYAQVGLAVDKVESERMLKGAVALFDKQFSELEAFALTSRLKQRVAEVRTLWGPFRDTALGPINKAGAQVLLQTNDDLLKACHALVLELQDFSGTAGARLVNIAGRQRMLSQRLAKFYMLQEWGFDGSGVQDAMDKANIEFTGGLAILSRSEINTAMTAKSLKHAQQMFDEYDRSLHKNGPEARMVVSRQADDLLHYMNDITGMYQDLATGKLAAR